MVSRGQLNVLVFVSVELISSSQNAIFVTKVELPVMCIMREGMSASLLISYDPRLRMRYQEAACIARMAVHFTESNGRGVS
jgi:hypothetical protein